MPESHSPRYLPPAMKTGDTIRDTQGTAWQVGQALGRGLWGKSFLVRREFDDAMFVLKAPLTPDDFRGEFPFSDVVISASRAAILEQARLYGDAGHPFLPRLEGRASLSPENTGYILPHFPSTLESRIAAALPLADLVETLLAVAKLARQLPGGFHGNLRARNVLLSESAGVFLTDVVTNAVPRALSRMLAANPALATAFPPEVSEASPGAAGAPVSEVLLNPGCDSWAIVMMLWEGVFAGEPLPNPPRQGLDKSAIQAVRDRVIDRMKSEDSNPRFHARLAERVAILMSRALSREQSPSPPFRFPKSEDLHGRLDEILQLIRPQVQSVGKVMLDRPASKPWFTTDEVVSFSCLAGASAGVEGNEEIGIGIAVFDAISGERLKDLPLAYTSERHPTGRYRFAFKIEGLYPGNFRARLAFAIRDSGQPPATAEVEFVVRPAPGWVPPEQPAPPPPAIEFGREQPSVTLVKPTPAADPAPEPAQAAAPVAPVAPVLARPTVTLPPPPAATLPPPAQPRPIPIQPSQPVLSKTATATAALPAPGPRVAPTAALPRRAQSLTLVPDDELDERFPLAGDAHATVEPLVPRPAPTARLSQPPISRPPVQATVDEEDDVPVRPKDGWNHDPVSASVQDLDDEDLGDGFPASPSEPSALARAWEQAKGDQYVLVVGGLSVVVLLLIGAVFFLH